MRVILVLVLLLGAMVAVAAAQTAEGCVWKDLNANSARDSNEPCESGWTLHAVVKDSTGTVMQQGDFVTNQLGSAQSGTPASNKFSYTLPTYSSGTWSVNITMAPQGISPSSQNYAVVSPTGAYYLKTYASGTTTVSGFSFGYKTVTYTAEGCYWIDVNGDGQQATDGTESCLAGQTLHATVTDGTNTIIDQDFTTNTAGTNGKFSYTLPAIPLGVTYYVTISEVPPNGYVVFTPTGASYIKSYTSATTVPVGGYAFGNLPVVASAQGCYWYDANKDGSRATDGTEPCLAGQTLHVTVTDDMGVVQKDEDFVTNASGVVADSVSSKFSEPLPVPPTGKSWTCTISELVVPANFKNIIPGGDVPSYSMTYSAVNPAISGFSFGHTDPPVPVPEFPTVAVSIFTISGMFVLVQFLRKRN